MVSVTQGYCRCGCEQQTPIASRTRHDLGHQKGQPTPFVAGHSLRWEPPLQRFLKQLKPSPTGCIEWQGFLVNGYGRIHRQGRQMPVHRFAYEQANGKIPPQYPLDHLCRNTRCVNPDHLEIVSHRVNILRGTSPSARNYQKTHCANSHPYSIENTWYQRDKRSTALSRVCRTCKCEHARQYRKRKQANGWSIQQVNGRSKWVKR